MNQTYFYEIYQITITYVLLLFQVVVVLQQVFTLIQTILSKWLDDSEVVEVGRFLLLA